MNTDRRPDFTAALMLALLGAIAWLGGCSDSSGPGGGPPPLPPGLVVSNPQLSTGSSAARLALSAGTVSPVAYVSLATGTIPTGSRATIRRVGSTQSFLAMRSEERRVGKECRL